jgi:SAM-dependent methyltransferase
MAVIDPTRRFSSRVEQYTKYRPGYPEEVLQVLRDECGLTPKSVIADVASGTGLFTRLLLENGNEVYAVEPNAEMRAAGEEFLAGSPRLHSIAGRAEETTLPDHSMDFVTAAQAAHWFDRDRTRREFVRILRPGGWTVLVWNERCTDTTPFLRAYEELLLRYGTDYADVRHERTTSTLDGFFAPSPFECRVFDYRQEFDYRGLEGRLLSSSYTPAAGEPNHVPMLRELKRVFDTYKESGRVAFDYKTRVYYSRLA